MSIIIQEYLKVVNKDTGEIEDFAVEVIDNKRNNVKRGWTRMYRYELDSVLRELTSRTEYDIYADIRDSNLPKTFALSFNQTKIAKRHNTTRQTVSRVIRKLKDTNFIKKIDNVYFINPFIIIPPMVDNKSVEEFQEKWKQLERVNNE